MAIPEYLLPKNTKGNSIYVSGDGNEDVPNFLKYRIDNPIDISQVKIEPPQITPSARPNSIQAVRESDANLTPFTPKLDLPNSKSLSNWDKYKNMNPNTPDWLKPLGYALETPFRVPIVNRLLGAAAKTAAGEDSIAPNAPINTYNSDSGKVLNTVADIAGSGLGMVVAPQYSGLSQIGNASENLALKGLNKLGSKAGTIEALPKFGQYAISGLRGAAEMGTLGAIESGLQGDTIHDTAKHAATNALMGAAFGVGGKAVGEAINALPKGLNKLNDAAVTSNRTYESTMPGYDINGNKLPKDFNNLPIKLNENLTVKNTLLPKAYENYDEAVREIQNKFGHYKLTMDEMKQGAQELGINFNQLLDYINTAEKGITPEMINNMAQRSTMSRYAGVKEVPKLIKPVLEPKAKTEVPINTLGNPDLTVGSKVIFNNKEYTLGSKQFDGQYNLLSNDGKSKLLVPPEFIQPGVKEVEQSSSMSFNKVNPQPVLNNNDVNIVKEDPLKDLHIDTWKNKSLPLLNRETIERNFEDIAGTDATKLKDTFVNPIKENETNAIRQKNALRDNIKEFGIKAGSKDSELAQKYGEGEITLEQLKDWTPNWENVKNMADYMRSTYDDLIMKANEVLERNNMRPISIRENYMPHQGEIEGLMKTLGLEPTELPTEINGLTPDFNPNKNFFANALQRKGDKTVYDAVRGFDNYIEGITKIIHHTDDIGRLRALEKGIREQVGEGTHLNDLVSYLKNYTNQIAGKQSRLDRGAEEVVGRKVYKFADTIRKQVSANMVGGNISSALTNFIPLTQSLATTDKTSFLKGMMDTISNIMKNDGFVDKSSFLTRRNGSDKIALSAWQKVGKSANWMFKIVDEFVGQTIVRGKYLEGIKQGLSEDTAMKRADDWAGRLMADRSLGMTPTLLNNKVISLLLPFQTEVNNQMSFLFKDLPRTYSNRSELASKAAQIAIYSYLFNNLYEKIMGRRPAFDVIGVIQKAYNDYTNDNLSVFDANKNLITNSAGQLPFVSTYLGGGRIPVSNAISDLYKLATGESDVKTELSKPLYYLFPPTGGGQIKKTLQGVNVVKNGGVYNDTKTQLKYPVSNTIGNNVKSVLFGPSSLQESQNYFNNKIKPLSTEQTKNFSNEVSKGNNPLKVYEQIANKRQLNSIKDEVSNFIKESRHSKEEQQRVVETVNQSANYIINNPSISQSEKIKQLKELKTYYK